MAEEEKPPLLIALVYEGDLTVRFDSKEQDAQITVDDAIKEYPPDVNQPNSIELFGSSVGICMIYIILKHAKKIDVTIDKVYLDYEMMLDEQAHIKKFELRFSSPFTAEATVLEDLEMAWKRCPVRNSLKPEIHLEFSFEWGIKR